jgi:hypothetical protein
MQNIREKLAWGLLAALGLFVVASMTGVVSGGPLDPTNPPGPTDGVRTAGTPISSLPFAITQPGYYYVTRDLTAPPSQHGISITSDDVTIDLGGFTIRAGNSPSGNAGILVNDINGLRRARNIEIRNGGLFGWGNGIDATYAAYSKIHDVTILGSSGIGISGQLSYDVHVWNCNVSLGEGTGIKITDGSIRDCTVTDNTFEGIRAEGRFLVEDNEVHGNDSYGIIVVGDNGVVRGNAFSASGSADILVDSSADGVTISGNVYCTLSFGMGAGLTLVDNVDRTTC